MIPEGLNAYADGKLLAGTVDRVGYLVINNPARHNAIGLDMWEAAAASVEAMQADADTRVLVVSGAGGKAFASGADISKFESERSTAEAVQHYQNTSARFHSALENFPKPTIADIRGYCIGGGLGLAVGCDIRICTEQSSFGIPAAKLGLGYGYDGVKRLCSIVSVSHAQEIFYTARQFSAREAYDMGLVNRVLPASAIDAFLQDYLRRICENAPMTLATAKAVTLAVKQDESQRDTERLEQMVRACFDSEDYIEGRRAFMEKRKPDFKGR